MESIDLRIAELAGQQRGVVHRRQLVALGLDRSALHRRVASGRLHALLPRVYAVGHRALPEGGREMAALLWRGPASVLSHESAAKILGLVTDAPVVHVSSAVGGTASRTGVRTHRLTQLDGVDVARREGLRITAPARTLLDLAEHTSATALERMVAEARFRRLVTDTALRDVVKRHRSRPGARALVLLLEDEHGPAFTRSGGEQALRALIRRSGLELPRTNVRLAGWEVDAFWAAQRLVVELDGYDAHSSRRAFERDRRKSATLEAAGYRVLRVTGRQLRDTPEMVAAVIASALARAA